MCGDSMRRQLIAFLALLTGLAALGTPAHASVVEALSCEIGVAADEVEGAQQEHPNCEGDESHAPGKGRDDADRPLKKPKRLMRPPVLFGVDRAYE